MAKHDGARDTELLQHVVKQLRLGLRRPHSGSRPFAMPISRSIKRNDAVFLGRQIVEPATFEILNHAAVAVKEHQRATTTALCIVEPDTVDLSELSSRRVNAFSLSGEHDV